MDRSAPHPSAYLAVSGFLSLQTLGLYWCTFPSFNAVRRLITALPSLTVLRMIEVDWRQPQHNLVVTPPHIGSGRPAIVELSLFLRAVQYQHVSAWLGVTPSRASLRRLSLVAHDDSHFFPLTPDQWSDAYTRLLRAVGPQLECLELPPEGTR